ncbi:hypothetical protein KQI38_10195 [Tissierella carlieri]|jgi:hypothetical protein|uniref:Uncharacterized protein n=1 Tax=Tissierella carlieri TaxID=689904 RepID=A0ABT1S8L3_9FIRM|nr:MULTISPECIES: hypothetical protein [Tissierella]MBU5312401.1 hypothetical protein [Tissierella carlieri]MCQ4922809.1 hypothetical protein [Tissierella carlieri]MDU5081018.1 hypothetical protein [Bacillota bacterium]
MNILLEKIDKTVDEMIDKNLIMDMTEQQMMNLIYEDELFTRTITSPCPTSFLVCC